MNYIWATATDIGHVRVTNEDTMYPRGDGQGPGPVVIAVADGMGGAVAGEIASRLAIEAASSPDEGTAIERVALSNRAVTDAVAGDPELFGMGTTLTLGIFRDDGVLELGHVGDSRAYLLRDGELGQVTRDHTLVADLVAQGKLTPEEAEHHPRRHLLTRAIGMAGIEPDGYEVELRDGDRVLLCSDGLTTMVDDAAVARLLGEGSDVAEAAWSLIEAANKAGGADNITVAVVDVSA